MINFYIILIISIHIGSGKNLNYPIYFFPLSLDALDSASL